MHLLLNGLTDPDRKIQAIKGVRAATNYSLMDAKAVIARLTGTPSWLGHQAGPQKLLDGASQETLESALHVLEEHGVVCTIVVGENDHVTVEAVSDGTMIALLLMGGDTWVGAAEKAISTARDLAAVTGAAEYQDALGLLEALHAKAVENGLF